MVAPGFCHGRKGRGYLRDITIQPLQEVSQTALAGRGVQTLEAAILRGMDGLRSQLKGATPGAVYRVSFPNGKLQLSQVRGYSSDVLPPADVVRELLVPQE